MNNPPIVRERTKKTNYFTEHKKVNLLLIVWLPGSRDRLGARSTSKCPLLEGNFRFQTTKQISDHHRSQIGPLSLTFYIQALTLTFSLVSQLFVQDCEGERVASDFLDRFYNESKRLKK